MHKLHIRLAIKTEATLLKERLGFGSDPSRHHTTIARIFDCRDDDLSHNSRAVTELLVPSLYSKLHQHDRLAHIVYPFITISTTLHRRGIKLGAVHVANRVGYEGVSCGEITLARWEGNLDCILDQAGGILATIYHRLRRSDFQIDSLRVPET